MEIVPRSALDQLLDLTNELRVAVTAVLQSSEIWEAITNEPGSSIMYLGRRHFWRPFPREAQPVIGQTRTLLDVWKDLATRAIGQPHRTDSIPSIRHHEFYVRWWSRARK